LGVFENGVVFGEDKFHVGMNNWGGSLNCLNDMELGNNVRMILFEDFFHSVWIKNIEGTYHDALELVEIPILLEAHV
jgi:hypothetical protein